MENNVITQRYKQLDPEYAKFVSSDFAAEAAKTLGRKAGLSGDSIDILENAFVLYLLLLLSLDELVAFIAKECTVEESYATSIGYAFVASLPEGYDALHASALEALNKNQATTDTKTDFSQDIADAQKAIDNMGNSVEPTYSSSQSDLLNK